MNKNSEIIIKPKIKSRLLDLREIWEYRELFWIFAWRDIKIRYRQTFLGVFWVIFQPLVSTFIFTIFFGNLAKIPSGNMPYSLFVLIGLTFWNFFSNSLSRASNCLLDNENIVKKVYFPKIILPFASMVVNYVDFLVTLVMVIIYSFVLGYNPSLKIILIFPFGLLIATLAACGLGTFLASINVKYRDIKFILPFFTQLLIFLTPVIYPSSIVRASNRFIMALNPMTGVIEAARSVFVKSNPIDLQILIISTVSSILMFIFGSIVFRKTERFFADIV